MELPKRQQLEGPKRRETSFAELKFGFVGVEKEIDGT